MDTKVLTPAKRTDMNAHTRMHLRRRVLDLLFCHEGCIHAPTGTEVHAVRLAARHLQPLLQLLKVLVPGDRMIARATEQVRGVLHHTSAARETHVYRKAVGMLPVPAALRNALGRAALRKELSAAEAMRKRLGRLDREGLVRLAARTWPRTTPAAYRRALKRAVAQGWERLQRRIAELRAGEAKALHKARVALKRFRYLVDAFAPYLPDMHPGRRTALKRYQARLGRWHDEQILADRLRVAARRVPPRHRQRCLQLAKAKAIW